MRVTGAPRQLLLLRHLIRDARKRRPPSLFGACESREPCPSRGARHEMRAPRRKGKRYTSHSCPQLPPQHTRWSPLVPRSDCASCEDRVFGAA
ncbi:hypothetical protein MRX96_013693 [Rhipicephalus microplus]